MNVAGPREIVSLPGTADEARKGEFVDERCDDRLSRVWRWVAPAWYQRTVAIPDRWAAGSRLRDARRPPRRHRRTKSFPIADGERILAEYGNHPSFVMLTLGNELDGDEAGGQHHDPVVSSLSRIAWSVSGLSRLSASSTNCPSLRHSFPSR